MDRLRDILRQYWAQLLAIGVFTCALAKYCRLNNAFDFNDHLEMIACAFAGLVAFIAGDVWSDWTEHYDVARLRWFTTPPWLVRMAGGIVLVCFTVALYRL